MEKIAAVIPGVFIVLPVHLYCTIHCRSPLALDTRCVSEKCNYCDMRCDICLQPVLHRFETRQYCTLGEVQCCSEKCSKFLFAGCQEIFMHEREVEGEKLQKHEEIMQGWFTIADPQYSGLKTTVQFVICEATKDTSSLYSIPSGTKYIKFWHRSIYKPNCIEYTIDGDFNALDVISIKSLMASFSDGEIKEMMSQLHKTIILAGVPYHLTKLSLMSN